MTEGLLPCKARSRSLAAIQTELRLSGREGEGKDTPRPEGDRNRRPSGTVRALASDLAGASVRNQISFALSHARCKNCEGDRSTLSARASVDAMLLGKRLAIGLCP